MLFLAGCIVLYFITQQLIANHKVPSLGEFIASSTGNTTGTSTPSATSTSASTTQKISSFVQMMNVIASSTLANPMDQDTQKSSSTSKNVTSTIFNLPATSLFAAGGSIKVFLADTETSREQGLSDILSLPNGEGALFVFDTPGKYGFWMKDMHFPIDLIWISADKTIAGVTKNVLPSSYPFVFMPPRDISYVLEMNAGSVTSFGLKTGTTVRFDLP